MCTHRATFGILVSKTFKISDYKRGPWQSVWSDPANDDTAGQFEELENILPVVSAFLVSGTAAAPHQVFVVDHL